VRSKHIWISRSICFPDENKILFLKKTENDSENTTRPTSHVMSNVMSVSEYFQNLLRSAVEPPKTAQPMLSMILASPLPSSSQQI